MNQPNSTIWLENKARADALRAVLAQLEASRWRPIAEAPKDGTRLLARSNKYGKETRIVCWDGEDWRCIPGNNLAVMSDSLDAVASASRHRQRGREVR